jgi:hypothetical protein
MRAGVALRIGSLRRSNASKVKELAKLATESTSEKLPNEVPGPKPEFGDNGIEAKAVGDMGTAHTEWLLGLSTRLGCTLIARAGKSRGAQQDQYGGRKKQELSSPGFKDLEVAGGGGGAQFSPSVLSPSELSATPPFFPLVLM